MVRSEHGAGWGGIRTCVKRNIHVLFPRAVRNQSGDKNCDHFI